MRYARERIVLVTFRTGRSCKENGPQGQRQKIAMVVCAHIFFFVKVHEADFASNCTLLFSCGNSL
jgi:hypothetical protein